MAHLSLEVSPEPVVPGQSETVLPNPLSLAPAPPVPVLPEVTTGPVSETDDHASRGTRPVESALIGRHRDALRGDVLELLPSGGPLTTALVGTARSYTGIGPSAALISVCRHFHRSGTFIQGDIRELAELGDKEFSAIVAAHGVIDLLAEEQRAALLDHLHRLLRPGGTLIFSSHNQAASDGEDDVPAPAGKRRTGRLGRLFRERHAFPEDCAPGEQGEGFAGAEGRYRISRDDQDRQLSEHGFSLIDCRDLDDREVPSGESGASSDELHYVARPL